MNKAIACVKNAKKSQNSIPSNTKKTNFKHFYRNDTHQGSLLQFLEIHLIYTRYSGRFETLHVNFIDCQT